MDDRARIQTQAIQESGLLNVTNEGRLFVLEGSHQGPFRGLLPAVPHELCLLALRDAPAAHRGGRRLWGGTSLVPSFLGMTLENQSWNSFGERGQRGRERTSTIKNSHGSTMGFFKSYFLKFILLWTLSLHHWLWILCIYLFKILSWVPTVCTLCVCNPDIARPPVDRQQSLFSAVPMQKNLHPDTCLHQSNRQITLSLCLVSYWQRR